MQPTQQTPVERDASASGAISGATGVPPTDRKDDSGLHDIRNLASSARSRLSSRRISTTPPIDEDVLASSSAGWKAVALPEPAKMVSLPDLADLPTKAEIKAIEKSARKSKPSDAPLTVAPVTDAPVAAAPVRAAPIAAPLTAVAAVEAAPIPMIGSRISGAARPVKQPGKNRGALIGVVGLGLAAAAGGAIYLGTRPSEPAAPVADNKIARASLETTPVAPAPKPEPSVATIATDEAATGAAAPDQAKPPEPADLGKDAKLDHSVKPKGAAVGKPSKTENPTTEAPPVADPALKKGDKPVKKDGEAEPNFDDLLKEAGVSDKHKEKGPVLDNKSLSGGDFKAGMSAIAGKAQGCYAGTQGTATVKLTVAPSGKVSKVSVSGAFAGTPVATCVENAVKNATFPPWDGGPQSFGYSYLLSE